MMMIIIIIIIMTIESVEQRPGWGVHVFATTFHLLFIEMSIPCLVPPGRNLWCGQVRPAPRVAPWSSVGHIIDVVNHVVQHIIQHVSMFSYLFWKKWQKQRGSEDLRGTSRFAERSESRGICAKSWRVWLAKIARLTATESWVWLGAWPWMISTSVVSVTTTLFESGGRPNHPSYPSCKGFKLWLEEIIRNRCLTMFNIRNLCLTVSITVITVPKMCSSSLQQVEVNPGDVLMAMVGAHPRHGGRIFKVGWPYYLSIHAIHRLYSHI